jgi:hypothetical protein
MISGETKDKVERLSEGRDAEESSERRGMLMEQWRRMAKSLSLDEPPW